MQPFNSNQALEALISGNKRFCEGNPIMQETTWPQLKESALTSDPFAIVLGCSDARIVPEIIFDQSLGNLYVVRVAGNILNNAILASIEYGLIHLHIPLIVVLGHRGCDAVDAAIDAAIKHQHTIGNIDAILEAIYPAVERAQDKEGNLLENVIQAHTLMAVEALKEKSIIQDLYDAGKVVIVGAYYDTETGIVDFVE
jgi:carbonic anhydrase